MSMVASFVAAASAALASAEFNTSRCQVGLTFANLGPDLTGDYIWEGNHFTHFPDFLPHFYFELGFTWKQPNRPQQAGWGCDFWDCTPEDMELATGKWAIATRIDIMDTKMKVLAVCEEGCPDFKPSCGDIYNQKSDDPDLIYCPIWPAAWNEPMKWRIVKTHNGTLPQPVEVTTDGQCCKRKPMECDACGASTCGGLIGLFHNNCPPNSGSLLHPVSQLQKDCCNIERPPPVELPVCVCNLPATQCDHSRDVHLVV